MSCDAGNYLLTTLLVAVQTLWDKSNNQRFVTTLNAPRNHPGRTQKPLSYHLPSAKLAHVVAVRNSRVIEIPSLASTLIFLLLIYSTSMTAERGTLQTWS